MPFSLSASLLDACVLAVLAQQDAYGYVLTQKLKEAFELSESTLYPVLRRLQKEELLTTYDQPYQGRNRRYYAITPLGRQKLADYRVDWMDYSNKIGNLLLEGAQKNEQQ